MVREDQVTTAAVDIEILSQVFLRHGCTLDVPSGPSLAPGAFPRRLSRLRHFPEGKIAARSLLGGRAAPFTLLGYAIIGILFGLARVKVILWLQLLLNVTNGVLNVTFVVGLGMGGWFLSTGIGNNLSGIFASAVSGESSCTVIAGAVFRPAS